MASRAGVPNRRTSQGKELIGPHVENVIAFLVEVCLTGASNQAMKDGELPQAYDTKDRLTAAKMLLEYGLSKPAQEVKHSGSDDPDALPVGIQVVFTDAPGDVPKQA